MKQHSIFDQMIYRFDKILQALPKSSPSLRTIAHNPQNDQLSEAEQAASASLMRVNHSGEVSAQALYLGQALVARDPELAKQLYEAAEEEQNHLKWCKERLTELSSKPSLLNPVWAVGSFGIGVVAGLAGDKISLGFLAETERQVTHHLEKHLDIISPNDAKSIEILQQMREDEKKHATRAVALGGVDLPKPICKLMTFFSKIMTTTTRYL